MQLHPHSAHAQPHCTSIPGWLQLAKCSSRGPVARRDKVILPNQHDRLMDQNSLLCVHGASLVGSEPSTLHTALQAQASSLSKGRSIRLYVYAPEHTEPAASQRLLGLLSQLYGAVGAVDPQLDVVPLLPFAGWSPGVHSVVLSLCESEGLTGLHVMSKECMRVQVIDVCQYS